MPNPNDILPAEAGDNFEVSPQIAAATKGMPRFIQQGAESLRRTYNPTMGAGGASDLQSRLSNKLRAMYGEERLRDMSDADIVEGYRRSKMPHLDINAATEQMRTALLPGYNPPQGGAMQAVGETVGGLVGGLARDIVGTTIATPVLAFNAATGNARLGALELKVQRMRAAGLSEDDPSMKDAIRQRDEQRLALHGTTQLLGPSAAVLGANILTEGIMGVGKSAMGAAAETGLGGRVVNATTKFLEARAPDALKATGKHILSPALHSAAAMGVWEGSKQTLLGHPEEALPAAWEGAKTGFIVGPIFHGAGAGLGAVGKKAAYHWGEAFPNLVHQTFREDGSALFDKLKENTASTIKDFKLDLNQEIVPQVETMLDKLYGPDIKGTAAGKKFVTDMAEHLEDYKIKNPPPPTPPQGATAPSAPGVEEPAKPINQDTPDAELQKTFTGTNGQQIVIKSPKTPLRLLESVYLRVDETQNPSLKEALWREIQSRNRDVRYTNLEKVKPPTWRQRGPEPSAGPDPRALPADWGSDPSHVFFNPDTPTEQAFVPGGAVDPHPRWRQVPEDSDNSRFPPRQRTIRDDLREIADDLVRRVEESKAIPEPDRPRPHPGWGELKWATTPDERLKLMDEATKLNREWGAGSAELVHDTGFGAALRVNKELEAHLSGGPGLRVYRPWKFVAEEPPEVARYSDADAVNALKMILRKMGFGDEPMAVASPEGGLHMTTAEEYAQELLDAARAGEPVVSEGAAGRTAWLNERAEAQAREENTARASAPATIEQEAQVWSGETPHQIFMSQLGEPSKTPAGKVTPGIRIIADKKVKVVMNDAGDAVVIGKVGHNIPEPQLRDIIKKADEHDVAIERAINDTPENKGKIKLLQDLGFVKKKIKDGATIFRREPRAPSAPAEPIAALPTTPAAQTPIPPPPAGGEPVAPAAPAPASLAPTPPAAPAAPAPREMGGRQIAIKLHTPPGAKKSDILKQWGDKGKKLNFLLRKDGSNGWVVVFDPKKIRLHAQAYSELMDMGIPDPHVKGGGWWDPKKKEYISQDIYNPTSPHESSSAPMLTSAHYEEALKNVQKEYANLGEEWFDNGPEVGLKMLEPLASALSTAWNVAKDSNNIGKLLSDHDYKNRIQLVYTAYSMWERPVPPEIEKIVSAMQPKK